MVYVDLKSTFDTVWGDGLVLKLARAGVRGLLLSWLRDYLHAWKLMVQIGGEHSPPQHLTMGTPQGAVLSPLLFNLMLSDMPSMEGITSYVYADDITVSCVGYIHTVRTRLQAYLHAFADWAHTWGLIVNPAKT